MRPIRSIAAAVGAAAALAAGPAAAQTAAELLGVYHMSILSKSGTDCPAEDDEAISIEIRRIAGAKLFFNEPGQSDDEIAEYDPATRSFRFEQAGSGDDSGVFTGRFTRQPDAVRLDMTVQVEGCSGTFAGFRPAPLLAAAPPPTAAPGAATSAVPGYQASSPGASPPTSTGAAQAETGMSSTRMAMFGAGGLGLLAVGAGLGWLLGRRKAEPPDASGPPEA